MLSRSLVGDFGGIYPTDTAAIKGISYFAADDGVRGKELWKCDGTVEGTALVRDIIAGSGSSSPQDFTAIGPKVVFFVKDSGNRTSLWMSDGTSDGTRMIRDFGVYKLSLPTQMVGQGAARRLMFTMDTGPDAAYDSSFALWSTDGTSADTVRLKDFATPLDWNLPYSLRQGDRSFFVQTNGLALFSTAGQLWATDGTPAGTTQLTAALDTALGTGASELRFVHDFVPLNGSAQFAVNSAGIGESLWITDGTVAGTRSLKQFQSGNFDGFNYFQKGSTARMYMLLVRSEGDEVVKTLWTTDGTVEGTNAIHEFRNASTLSPPSEALNNSAVLNWYHDQQGMEIWISDGTEVGTRVLKAFTFEPGGHVSASTYETIGGLTFFFLQSRVSSSDVWSFRLWPTGGTTAGTVQVDDLAAHQPVNQRYGAHLELSEVDGQLAVTRHEWDDAKQLSVVKETVLFDPASIGPAVGPKQSRLQLDNDRVLRVFGTRGADNIRIYKMDGHEDAPRFVVNLNGTRRSFALADVRKLLVYGYSDDDAIAFVETHGLMTLRSMIWAGAGDDTIHGDSTRDSIWGEAGDDLISTGRSADLVDGGIGDDTIFGSIGNDTLKGQAGRDSLIGGRDDDLLSGGNDESDDHLDGGTGADVIFGKAVIEIFYNGKQTSDGDPLDEVLLG